MVTPPCLRGDSGWNFARVVLEVVRWVVCENGYNCCLPYGVNPRYLVTRFRAVFTFIFGCIFWYRDSSVVDILM